jgi:ABC-type polysaccharide/polyol phosphate export permease
MRKHVDHEVGGKLHIAASVGDDRPRLADYVRKGLEDFKRAALDWRIWSMLGTMDVVKRYRRSRIGPFWITASMAILVAGLGVVYSGIFGTSIREYLPYVAVSIVVWNLISSLVNEGCGAFLESDSYMKHLNLAKATFVLRVIFRNLLMAAHNIIIVPIVIVLFAIPVHWTMLLFFPAVLLIVLNGLWIGLLLGTLSARFRDIPQMVQSIMQVVFFVTPVMFHPKQLSAHVHSIVELSPFAASLALARDPILGNVWRLQDVIVVLVCLCVGWLVVIPFFGKFRDRIVYWL